MVVGPSMYIGVLQTCITSYLGQYLHCIIKITERSTFHWPACIKKLSYAILEMGLATLPYEKLNSDDVIIYCPFFVASVEDYWKQHAWVWTVH